MNQTNVSLDKLTEIQADRGIALAKLVLCIDFVFAGIVHCHIVDLQTNEVGILLFL